jgi:hypothetical protein
MAAMLASVTAETPPVEVGLRPPAIVRPCLRPRTEHSLLRAGPQGKLVWSDSAAGASRPSGGTVCASRLRAARLATCPILESPTGRCASGPYLVHWMRWDRLPVCPPSAWTAQRIGAGQAFHSPSVSRSAPGGAVHFRESQAGSSGATLKGRFLPPQGAGGLSGHASKERHPSLQ